MTIGKLWAGRFFGTNTGKLFIEFTEVGENLSGTLRTLDDNFGIVVYTVSGQFPEQLELIGTPMQHAEGVVVSDISINAQLSPEGTLRGQWSSSLGTGGTFVAFPHDIDTQQVSSEISPNIPEQIHSKHVELNSLRIFLNDIRKLIDQVRQDFNSRVIVTYNAHGKDGSEISKYAEDFLEETDTLGNLSFLKLFVQEPDAHGINRMAIVELRSHGSNDIRVQGVQDSWVIGKAQNLANFLQRYESMPISAYKKFGLNINQAIFFALIVLMPSIDSIWNRVLFAGLVLLLLQTLWHFHSRYIPNAYISMSQKRPNWLIRNWPSIVSWIMGITGTVIATLVGYYITGTNQ